MNGTDINELVERAKNGDKAAIDELYRAYYDQLLKFVMKQGVSEFDAQDVVSDTFIEMMKHIGDLRENAYFSTWLHTIAKRKAGEHLEKANRRQRVTFDTADSEDSGLSNLGGDEAAVELAYENTYGDTVMLPADYAENEEIKQIIAEQISSLSDEHKEALFLFYYQNKSIAEIAELTGTNQNNVKARLFHARKNLRKKLEALRKKGVVLCAVPFASLIPHFGSLLSGALGAGTAAAVGATAGTMTTSGAASAAATGAAAGTMTTGGAASAAATGAAAGLGAGAAGSAAVTGAVAGLSKTGKGTAAATTSGFGMKAILITIVTVVTVTVTTVVVTKFTSGKDDDDKKASSSAAVMAEPESRTEAVSRTDSDEDDSSVPEVEADAVLVMPNEEIPITFGEVNYRAWQHPDLTKDHAYVFIQGFSPEYSDKFLLTEYKDKKLTPIESEDGGFCTIESERLPAYDCYFRNGSALFIDKYDWYAVFPSEGRIDVHSTEQNGPEDNWFYGMVLDESGDVYDGTSDPPVAWPADPAMSADISNCIREFGDYSMMIMPNSGDNFTVEIDPDTLRPIVEAPKPQSPEDLTGWQKSYYDFIQEYDATHSNAYFGLADVNGDGRPELLARSSVPSDDSYMQMNQSVIVSDDDGNLNELQFATPDDLYGNSNQVRYTGKSNVIMVETIYAMGAHGSSADLMFFEIDNGVFKKLDHTGTYEMSTAGITGDQAFSGYTIDGVDMDNASMDGFLRDVMGGTELKVSSYSFSADSAFTSIITYSKTE